MPGLPLFSKQLIDLRARVVEHPLSDSRTLEQLVRLTTLVMLRSDSKALSDLITMVHALNQRYTEIKPAWKNLPRKTQATLADVFEDIDTPEKTKENLLSDLRRLSTEKDPAKYQAGREHIIEFCTALEPRYAILHSMGPDF